MKIKISAGAERDISNGFPFGIWYGVKEDFVVVYAVLDGRRDPDQNARTLRSRRNQVS